MLYIYIYIYSGVLYFPFVNVNFALLMITHSIFDVFKPDFRETKWKKEDRHRF